MKNSKITQGRINQKLQTRLEILEAAKSLMHEEKKITLEDVAKKANISRATMYRYYSNIDLLFMEATLEIHHKTSEQILEEVKQMPLSDRLFYIQDHYNELAQKNEIVFRRYLSAVLNESIVSKEQLRGARRVRTLNIALEPFKESLPKENLEKFINISTLLMGIDPVITCKDVCNLDEEETKNTLKWALEMILKGMDMK